MNTPLIKFPISPEKIFFQVQNYFHPRQILSLWLFSLSFLKFRDLEKNFRPPPEKYSKSRNAEIYVINTVQFDSGSTWVWEIFHHFYTWHISGGFRVWATHWDSFFRCALKIWHSCPGKKHLEKKFQLFFQIKKTFVWVVSPSHKTASRCRILCWIHIWTYLCPFDCPLWTSDMRYMFFRDLAAGEKKNVFWNNGFWTIPLFFPRSVSHGKTNGVSCVGFGWLSWFFSSFLCIKFPYVRARGQPKLKSVIFIPRCWKYGP